MILLDTDHLSVLKYDEHPRCRALHERMSASEDPFFATTIVSAEVQMRGWLAEIHVSQEFDQPSQLIVPRDLFLRTSPSWRSPSARGVHCSRGIADTSFGCTGRTLRTAASSSARKITTGPVKLPESMPSF